MLPVCTWGWDTSWILGSFPCPASLQKPDCLSLESPSICPQHLRAHISLSTLGLCSVWSYTGCPYCCCSSRWQPLCCVQKTMFPYRYLGPLALVIFLPPLSRGSLSLWRKECDMDFPFTAGHSAVSCNLTSCGPPCELPSMQQEASLKGTRSCLGSASQLSLRYLSVSGSLTQTTVTWVQPGNKYIRMTLLSLAQTELERWGGKKSKQG